MKKVLLTVAAIFAFGFANAQDVKFGVKAGLNFANLTGDAEDNSMRVSFHVGGLAEIKLSNKFAIQPELLFSSQGAKFDTNTSEKLVYDLSYINVPVLAKFYATPQFYLEAGPQIGFIVSAKAKYDGDSEDIKNSFNSTDFGLNIGGGYNFTDNIYAGLRYTAGLSNIADVPDESNFETGNSVIALSVGYRF